MNVRAITYTPNKPTGPTSCAINIEYQYSMITMDSDSSWKFDWGDGTYSDWINSCETCNQIYENNSWNKIGSYNVRIKYRNKYMEESPWSSALVVNVGLTAYPNDNNNNGGNDDIQDSDDDGLNDYIEEMLNSNPENKLDVLEIEINYNIYYLVDTNNNNEFDKSYDENTNINSSLKIQSDGTCLIDINDDSKWDYVYSFKDKSVRSYNAEIESNKSFEFPWITAVIIIIIAVLIVVLLLFKTGIFFIYEEEYEIEE